MSGFIGINEAITITWMIPATPMAVSITVHVFSVSFSVNPLIRCTTQNPLSFIHESGKAPKPIARQK